MAKHTTSWELLINCFQEPQCYFLCYCTTDLATAAITVCLILSLSILHLHQRSHYGGVITKFEQKKNHWKSLFLCILKYWSIDLSNLLQNFNSFLAIDAPCSLSKRNPINSSVNPHFTWWLRLMAEHPIHIKWTYSRSSKTYRIKACIHTEPCPSAKSITWSAQIWSQTVSNWDVN